jgi:hypothetical protein
LIDLLRRVAVLSLISAAGIGLLAPLSVRSATPMSPSTDRLLVAAEELHAGVSRSALAGRENPSRLSLVSLSSAPTVETVGLATPQPTPASVAFAARIQPVATPRPTPAPPVLSGDTITGKATYYCCSLGYRGQAVVALPGALGGHYDTPPASRYVTICAERCASLPVVDYCACHWGTASQKVADLSPEAWAAISDSNHRVMGVLRVTIHLG